MGKEVFGEYAAFTTRGGIRFQKNNLMTSEKAIPPEVVAFLKSKIEKAETNVPSVPKFPMPTEEEKARLRAESLKVPEELKLTPEEESSRVVPDNEAPLTADDFDEPPQPIAESQPIAEPQLTAEPQPVDSDFLESVSIHTAPLEALAQALFDRFGIYSVYLGELPRGDEVNPLTGDYFTKYHLGIAYQAAISVQANGISNPELARPTIDRNRAAHENFQDKFVPAPVTMGEARRQDSFAFRTSTAGNRTVPTTEIVHIKDEVTGEVKAVQRELPVQENGSVARSRYDKDEDEQVIEPPIFGTKPIIKPNW